MKRQHPHRDIFLHHPLDARFEHAHDLRLRRRRRQVELVDAGAHREQQLKPVKPLHMRRRRPCQEVAHALGRDGLQPLRESDIGKRRSEAAREDRAAFGIGIEDEGQGALALVHGSESGLTG